MKLRKVRLQAFRNHIDSTLDLQDASFVVVRGGNFSGKTSIAQAISMGLTPSTVGLDAQGRGFVGKIKRGEQKAVITLDVQGGTHLVRQEVALNLNTSGRTSRSVCLDDPDWKPLPFDNLLKTKKDALMVCLNTDFFLKMDEASQKSLMAGLVLPSHYDFPVDKMAAVEKTLGQGAIDFTAEPISVIEKAYKKLYDERQIVNRQVKEFTVPEALPSVSEHPEVLQEALQATVERRDVALRKTNEVNVQRAKLEAEITSLLEQVDTHKVRLKAIEPLIMSLDALRDTREVSEKAADAEHLQKMLIECGVRVVYRSETVAKFKSLLKKESSECTACGQPVTKGYVTDSLSEAEDALKVAEKDKEDTQAALAALGDVGAAREKIEKHASALGERARIDTAIQDLVAKGKTARAALAVLGEPEDAAQAMTEMEAKVAHLTERLRPAIAFEERTKEIATRKQQLEKLKAKAANVDALVKFFDKDGIKAQLLADYIGGFESAINEIMSAFKFKCSLSIEPYRFEITNARGDVNPISEISGAERRIFEAAFQCAVSRAAGIGIAVVDEVDRLHPGIRPILNKALYTLVDQALLEQVIMIVADTTMPIPKLSNTAFFMVTDGAVQKLIQSGGE